MKKKLLLLVTLLLILLSTACSQQETSGSQLDYEETKKMVVDILKTDDGKKAIQEVMSDEKLRQSLIMDQAVVTDTIQTTLTSDKGAEFWKKNFEDPKFAETMAKSMQAEHEAMLKNLMNDTEYRTKLIEVLKDPELEQELSNVLKGNEYREHLKQVVTETLESPLYQAKIQDLLLKAADNKASEEKKAADSA